MQITSPRSTVPLQQFIHWSHRHQSHVRIKPFVKRGDGLMMFALAEYSFEGGSRHEWIHTILSSLGKKIVFIELKAWTQRGERREIIHLNHNDLLPLQKV